MFQSKFSNFNTDELIMFETQILTKSCCKISQLCTPSNFTHYLVELVPDLPDKHNLLRHADILISQFWGGTYIIVVLNAVSVSRVKLLIKPYAPNCTQTPRPSCMRRPPSQFPPSCFPFPY
jgi:hypothetical protein